MSNLVGTGLNQAPTNSMLGGLAYQDPAHASIKDLDLKNLSQINSETADTAVDVFVYDTSKDSDGGAWRKRTQHTSWYNETLNTAIRGSRKEFPAVAVIVAETTKVTIYDGDDPDLPMWMVFTWSGNVDNLLGYSNRAKSAITAVNGYLITCSDPDGVHIARFIHDDGIRYTHVNNVYTSDAIANRTNTIYRTKTTTALIVASTCNDVAATVLPNAPIDDATGLPIPTIVVATDSGVSAIKDDGTVVNFSDNLGATRAFKTVTIVGEDIIGYNDPNGTVQRFFNALGIGTNDDVEMKYNYTYGGGGGSTENISAVLRATSGANILVEKGETAKDFYAANVDGISVFHDGEDRNFTPTSFSIYDSSVSYITSDYNTGWMYGDIRGAFLSDTDTTNVTGSELVTNGTFASNTSGWTAGSNATISSVSGQLNIVTGSSGGDLYAYQTITGLSAGEYILIVDVISNPSNRGILRVGSGGANTSNIGYIQYITGTGTKILNFTLTSSTDVTITLFNDVLNATGIWDNVTLRRAELDRSVSNNSLQVYGTITKSAVATGAELVAYSGFSGSNYLLQPHNSDLAPGTDPYCIMVWVKTGTSGADQYIYDRSSQVSTSTRDY